MASKRPGKTGTAPQAAPPPRDISPGRKRFVEIWTRVWGLIGALIVVFVAYYLPAQMQAGDGSALLRSLGLLLVSFNLIMQAVRPLWPIVYALPLTVFGITLWLLGWLE